MNGLPIHLIQLLLLHDESLEYDELNLYESDMFALLDRDDYERLVQYRWTVKKGRKTFYAIRFIEKGIYELLHHAVIGRVPPLPYVVDHINANGLDNRRSNLQVITNADNIRRASKPDAGVYRVSNNKRNPWKAETTIDYKTIHIGYFPTKDEAIEARREFMKSREGS